MNATPPRHTLLSGIARAGGFLGPCTGLIAVFLLFSLIGPSAFHSVYNIKTIITQTVITGIGALGMTFIIISGGIDLSVGSLIALATVIVAKVLALGPESPGMMWPVIAILAACAVCALCGCINGALSASLRIVPFIVTLGMMQIARGIAKWLAHQQTVIAPESWLNYTMDVIPSPSWLQLAYGVWGLLVLTGGVACVLRYTVCGRYVFALGSNEAAARLCGIRIIRQKIYVYTLGGLFAGMAGVAQYANLTVGDPTAAMGMELDIIAAVVIGGGSLRGGEGSATGTLIGALIMAVLRNGCNLIGIPSYTQNIVIGVVIIGAVAMDRIKHR